MRGQLTAASGVRERPARGRGACDATPRWLGVARLATLVALAGFAAALAAAAAAYPGGSWTQPGAEGFSVYRNFWCDLLRSRAINGGDNTVGRLLATAAFGALGVGLWPYWWVAGAVLPGRRGWLVSCLGTASAAGLVALALLPSDRFPIAHGVVALTAGALGMAAAGTSVAARLPGEAALGLRRTSGALTLVCALLNAALYIYVAWLGGAETPLQPAVQKLATALLVTWMLATVVRARRPPRVA